MSIEQHLYFSALHTRHTAEEKIRTNRVPILRKSSIANHYALTIINIDKQIAHYLVQQRPTMCAIVSESGEIYNEYSNAHEMINQVAFRRYAPAQPTLNQDPQ